MNIMPMPVPTVAATLENTRQHAQPTHEIARPVAAPKASEGMAHETQRDEDTRPGRTVERDVQQQSRQTSPNNTVQTETLAEAAPATQRTADNRQVGALLDVFA